MTLDVNKEELTIMGVKFDSFRLFKSVWYAISTNMIEGSIPKVKEVIRLREEAIVLGIS
ncbi:hypothetical protein IGJ91_002077 [Enterococcus sp. DIV0765f]|uniref:hypothetical protein n=1 Tax=Enterococcus TaxID=1350 RepID=UPI001FBBB2D7|nr:hypothetical protein [Enterococcus mundtii]GKS53895.1 hypothetical protein EMLAB_05100 [Enterococcus mundtii]